MASYVKGIAIYVATNRHETLHKLNPAETGQDTLATSLYYEFETLK